MQRYTGTLMISYYSGYGKDRHLVHETLHAHVDKPKPVYSKETYLVYGNEAANHLTFSRSPSCINSLKDEKAGFGYDTNKVTILGKSGVVFTSELKSKREIARDILDVVMKNVNI